MSATGDRDHDEHSASATERKRALRAHIRQILLRHRPPRATAGGDGTSRRP